MKDTIYWIWLSKIKELTVLEKKKLLSKYTIEELWNLSRLDVFEVLKDEEKSDAILNKIYRVNLQKYLDYMKTNSINLISIYDEEYPQKLKEIYDPPLVLYVKGNRKILNDLSIAIVGARNASEYGQKTAKSMAYMLSKNNINVVSGLARGIDTNAHLGAVRAKRKYNSSYWKWIRSNISYRKQVFI